MPSTQIYMIRGWFFVALWMGFIFAFSSLSVIPGPDIFFWDYLLKKGGHMFVYAVLFFLIIKALNPPKDHSLKYAGLAFTLCLLYAISDEFHQSFTPGRFPQPLDVYYDMLGSTTSYLLLSQKI